MVASICQRLLMQSTNVDNRSPTERPNQPDQIATGINPESLVSLFRL